VDFADNTTNNPVNWNWNFGDGKISLSQNPKHIFEKPGIYNVRLVSWNTSGVDTIYKTVDMSKVLYVDYSRPDTIRAGVPAQFYDSCIVATQWQWFFGDGGSSTLKNPVHTYTNPGVYFVSFIASNADCSKTINKQITVYSGIGIAEETISSVRIYPVPANDFVMVEWGLETSFAAAKVVDALGNTLTELAPTANELKIDASNFADGIYFVMLTTQNGKTVVKKFVIAR
jgi:PKD repeat protein